MSLEPEKDEIYARIGRHPKIREQFSYVRNFLLV